MKKTILLLTVILLGITSTNATIIRITVSDFQFKPKVVNAVAGDTILWMWKSGVHTTTSLTIPANAKTWNAPMDATHKRFGYKIIKTGVYNYQCNIHATIMKGTINVSAALSGGLNSFVINEDNAGALLNWKTVSSKDVAYFSVQSSTDGENFSEITRVKPNTANTYKITDNSAATGKYIYYQVEMIDTKGNRQLSSIEMFSNNKTVTSKLITSISPNPINKPGHLMLQFNADKNGVMLVKLFSQSGRFIKQAEMSAAKGLNNGHFHMGDLAPGAYYIVCTLGAAAEKHTIIMK